MLSELPEEIALILNNHEKKVIKARLTDCSFSQIEEKYIQWHIDQVMIRAAAIGGCAIPNTDFFAQIIGEELLDFIVNFGFGELTYEEIILAFKLNATGAVRFPSGDYMDRVTFSGTCFNIDYLSKILSNYMLLRNSLDRKIQNKIDGY